MTTNRYARVPSLGNRRSQDNSAAPGRNSAAFGLVLVLIVAAGISLLIAMGIRMVIGQGDRPEPATASEASCPIEETLALPNLGPPRGIYILVDTTRSFRAHAQRAIDVLKTVLPQVLSYGDRLTAAWIGNHSASSDSTFCCGRAIDQIPLPTLLAIPEEPLLPQVLETGPDASSIDIAEIRAINESNAAKYETDLNHYRCRLVERNADAEKKIGQWQSDQQAILKAFWHEAEPSFALQRFDNSTQIREALYRASLVLQQDEVRKARFLLLLTDLEEVGAPNFKGIDPDLTGVQAIVVFSCNESAQKCEALKAEWREVFTGMGAVSPIFLDDVYPEEALVSLLKRSQ